MHFNGLLNICVLLSAFLVSTPSYGGMHNEGDLIYDDTLKIYWTKNANMNGLMSWSEVTDWIADLNANHFGGYDDWRLPTTPDGTWGYSSNGNAGKYNVTTSELGHLYYTSFGLSAKNQTTMQSYTHQDLSEYGDPFEGLQPGLYWFGTISDMILLQGHKTFWKFDFGRGTQFIEANDNSAYALAVRSAAPVPIPSSFWIFLMSLLALFLKRAHSEP